MHQLLPHLLLTSLLLTACNFREEKNQATDKPVDLPTFDSAQLTYAEVKDKVLDPYCTSCHSDAGGNLGATNLDSYAAVKAKAERVRVRTLEDKNSPMPPGGAIDLSSKALLKAWLDQGAPETTNP
ncbi:MAG: hypothetical protein ACOVS5_05885 [Oligoflexus sp.]|jgi:hypothetical protein